MKMRWNASNLVSGMQSLLGGLSSHDSNRSQLAIDDIRQAMLESMGEPASEAYPVVQLRITYANDLQDLWYLRGDVMAAIAAVHGEAIARHKLSHISELFRGLLPRGLASRPSPLGE